ncbi:MAG: hypothetical protein R6U94_01225 [Nitriliruptoraceae bacterium]
MTATRPHLHRPTPILAAAGMFAGLFLLNGCAGGDLTAGDAASEAEAAEDADAGDDASAASSPEMIEVEMVDFGYVGLPASVPAGTQLTVSNRADEELHELVAFALPDDEERSVEELTELGPGELVAALGEPVTVLLAEPGGQAIPAVGDGTLSAPGRYAIMCFIPTGVEPKVYLEAAAATEEGPPQVQGGPPHFVNGMFRELVVE